MMLWFYHFVVRLFQSDYFDGKVVRLFDSMDFYLELLHLDWLSLNPLLFTFTAQFQ